MYEKVRITRLIECVLFIPKVVFFVKMKVKLTVLILFVTTLLNIDLIVTEVKAADTISEERYKKVCRWGILNPPECKKRVVRTRTNNKNPGKKLKKNKLTFGLLKFIINPVKNKFLSLEGLSELFWFLIEFIQI